MSLSSAFWLSGPLTKDGNFTYRINTNYYTALLLSFRSLAWALPTSGGELFFDDCCYAYNDRCQGKWLTFDLAVSWGPSYCIPNAVGDATADRKLRLNPNAHPLSYVNDQDMGTAWLSHTGTPQGAAGDGLTLTVDLANGQYQVTHTRTAVSSG